MTGKHSAITHQMTLRVPPGVKDLLRAFAAIDRVSLAAEANRLLVEGCKARADRLNAFDVVGPQPPRHPNTIDSPFGEFHP